MGMITSRDISVKQGLRESPKRTGLGLRTTWKVALYLQVEKFKGKC